MWIVVVVAAAAVAAAAVAVDITDCFVCIYIYTINGYDEFYRINERLSLTIYLKTPVYNDFLYASSELISFIL